MYWKASLEIFSHVAKVLFKYHYYCGEEKFFGSYAHIINLLNERYALGTSVHEGYCMIYEPGVMLCHVSEHRFLC